MKRSRWVLVAAGRRDRFAFPSHHSPIAQRRRLPAHCLQLFHRHGGHGADARLQRHHDPDEYGLRAGHRPHATRQV